MGDKEMTRITLMVDDMRLPNFPETTTVVTTPKAALTQLRSDIVWDRIFLDHDLGEDAQGNLLDIWPVIAEIEKQAKRRSALEFDPIIYIISSNPSGVKRMKQALDQTRLLSIVVTEDQKTLLFHFRDWVND